MSKGNEPPKEWVDQQQSNYTDRWQNAAAQQANSSSQAANAQTEANRPNITTPFGQQQWSQNPDGSWAMSTGFSGGMGDAANNLQAQYAQAMANPFSFGQFGEVGTGDQARDQAINAAYGQASSRLDPMWNQREEATRTRLLNQGLDPSSEAYRNEMGSIGQQRNDAYMGAMNSAIGQGTAAGSQAFQNNMMARQQAIAEALRQRGMPMEDMQKMQGFLAMPGFSAAGRADPMQWLSAMQGSYGHQLQQQQAQAQQTADIIKAGATIATAAI
jgi:hypothetical protein